MSRFNWRPMIAAAAYSPETVEYFAQLVWRGGVHTEHNPTARCECRMNALKITAGGGFGDKWSRKPGQRENGIVIELLDALQSKLHAPTHTACGQVFASKTQS